MPEVAEIKISTEQINSIFKNRIVNNLSFLQTGRYKTKMPVGYAKLQELLQIHPKGLVAQSQCHGKLQYIGFYDGTKWLACALVTHGMTGHWVTVPTTGHICAQLSFLDGTQLFFEDIRRFGTFKFVFSEAEVQAKIDTLGLDILEAPIDALINCVKAATKKTKNITQFLMAQDKLAGVGNYIKAETLYKAKISPHRCMTSLSENEAALLAQTAQTVAQESYKQQGLYFRNHQLVDGQTGAFDKQLDVYRKTHDPLGNPVISEDTLDKRTTWWVPNVQQ